MEAYRSGQCTGMPESHELHQPGKEEPDKLSQQGHIGRAEVRALRAVLEGGPTGGQGLPRLWKPPRLFGRARMRRQMRGGPMRPGPDSSAGTRTGAPRESQEALELWAGRGEQSLFLMLRKLPAQAGCVYAKAAGAQGPELVAIGSLSDLRWVRRAAGRGPLPSRSPG